MSTEMRADGTPKSQFELVNRLHEAAKLQRHPEVQAAINVIARDALHRATEDAPIAEWDDYPEIGEGDWDDVIAEISRITPAPDKAEFDAAYALLAMRADH